MTLTILTEAAFNNNTDANGNQTC